MSINIGWRNLIALIASAAVATAVAKPLTAQQPGAIDGLGIYVTTANGQIKVVAPIDNTPAAKAGIMAGDIIVALDDEPMQGLTLSQAVEKMRGPVNTTIKLTIMRSGRETPIEFSMIRAVIRQGAGRQAAAPETSAEAENYQLANDVNTREVWAAFINRYKTGFYTTLARGKLQRLLDAEAANKPKEP
jgi:predicted metalloprotease with PDZ domain